MGCPHIDGCSGLGSFGCCRDSAHPKPIICRAWRPLTLPHRSGGGGEERSLCCSSLETHRHGVGSSEQQRCSANCEAANGAACSMGQVGQGIGEARKAGWTCHHEDGDHQSPALCTLLCLLDWQSCEYCTHNRAFVPKFKEIKRERKNQQEGVPCCQGQRAEAVTALSVTAVSWAAWGSAWSSSPGPTECPSCWIPSTSSTATKPRASRETAMLVLPWGKAAKKIAKKIVKKKKTTKNSSTPEVRQDSSMQ